MDNSFDQILQHAVAPIVLISGVGLILLSLNNRYSNALAKSRSIINQFGNTPDATRRLNLQNQITILLSRCNILRLSIAAVVASTILSSSIVLIAVATAFLQFNPDRILMGLLFVSCLCIMIANLLFLWDIVLSLRALKLEVAYSVNYHQSNKT